MADNRVPAVVPGSPAATSDNAWMAAYARRRAAARVRPYNRVEAAEIESRSAGAALGRVWQAARAAADGRAARRAKIAAIERDAAIIERAMARSRVSRARARAIIRGSGGPGRAAPREISRSGHAACPPCNHCGDRRCDYVTCRTG